MQTFNIDSLETDDSNLYDCLLRPCRYCSSIEPCEAFDASASNISSVCPYFWKPIPQTEDEMNEQMRLFYEQCDYEEWAKEA